MSKSKLTKDGSIKLKKDANKKAPFTDGENTILLELFLDNKHVLLSKFRSNIRNMDKRKIWTVNCFYSKIHKQIHYIKVVGI